MFYHRDFGDNSLSSFGICDNDEVDSCGNPVSCMISDIPREAASQTGAVTNEMSIGTEDTYIGISLQAHDGNQYRDSSFSPSCCCSRFGLCSVIVGARATTSPSATKCARANSRSTNPFRRPLMPVAPCSTRQQPTKSCRRLLRRRPCKSTKKPPTSSPTTSAPASQHSKRFSRAKPRLSTTRNSPSSSANTWTSISAPSLSSCQPPIPR